MKQDPEFAKSLPAGTTPHNALVRWLTTESKIDLAIIRIRNIEEFADTYSGAGRELRAADSRAISLMSARADSTACRLCTQCQPYCPSMSRSRKYCALNATHSMTAIWTRLRLCTRISTGRPVTASRAAPAWSIAPSNSGSLKS